MRRSLLARPPRQDPILFVNKLNIWEDPMTTDPKTQTMERLKAELDELVNHVTALRAFAQPGYDPQSFHQHYDPMMEAARRAHDIHHEILEL